MSVALQTINDGDCLRFSKLMAISDRNGVLLEEVVMSCRSYTVALHFDVEIKQQDGSDLAEEDLRHIVREHFDGVFPERMQYHGMDGDDIVEFVQVYKVTATAPLVEEHCRAGWEVLTNHIYEYRSKLLSGYGVEGVGVGACR